jgi:hypothetical protein
MRVSRGIAAVWCGLMVLIWLCVLLMNWEYLQKLTIR